MPETLVGALAGVYKCAALVSKDIITPNLSSDYVNAVIMVFILGTLRKILEKNAKNETEDAQTLVNLLVLILLTLTFHRYFCLVFVTGRCRCLNCLERIFGY